MVNIHEISKISTFYRDKAVFITGGTGFIGKVLVEKLLRSCSEVKRVYLLVREKRGIASHKRIEQMFESKLFDRIREEQPRVLEKISCVVGSMESSNLGMSFEDYNAISNEVSIIIHSAAYLKFNETLRSSLLNNLLGTKHIIDLAKNCKNIQALVHISTAFCNTHQENIYETVYPTEFPARNIANCLSWMNDEMLERLKPMLLSRHPNYYCYSKCLAEQLLSEEGGTLPVVVVRPSIVLSSYKEPFEGWIEGRNIITVLSIAVSKGIIKAIYHPSKRKDIVPVDYCANLILASAWHKSLQGNAESLTVYNCSSDTVNSAWKKGNGSEIITMNSSYPSINFYRYPNVRVINNKFLYELYNTVTHLLPSILYDAFLLITGQKPRMFQQYKRFRAIAKDTEYFFANDWYFYSENFKVLLNEMSEDDKKIFDIDVRNINWKKYLDSFPLGLHQYLLNEDSSTIQIARTRVKRWYYVTMGVSTLGFGIICALPLCIIIRFF